MPPSSDTKLFCLHSHLSWNSIVRFIVLIFAMIFQLRPGISTAAQSMDWMKGISIESSATSRQKFTNSNSFELNTRVFNVYISTKGHIFDYSELYGNTLIADKLVGNKFGDTNQMHMAGFFDKWQMGNVTQEWIFSTDGLVRYIRINRGDMACSIRSEIRSSRPDHKFFFYAFKDGRPIEIEKYEQYASAYTRRTCFRRTSEILELRVS
jgi:hypothetical protein